MRNIEGFVEKNDWNYFETKFSESLLIYMSKIFFFPSYNRSALDCIMLKEVFYDCSKTICLISRH